jgi:hypothetical protein
VSGKHATLKCLYISSFHIQNWLKIHLGYLCRLFFFMWSESMGGQVCACMHMSTSACLSACLYPVLM